MLISEIISKEKLSTGVGYVEEWRKEKGYSGN